MGKKNKNNSGKESRNHLAETAKVKEAQKAAKAAAETAAAEKTALTEEMLIQFGENEVAVKDISDKVRRSFLENGQAADLKEIKIYVKPEDNKAYYVINGQTKGSIDLA